MKTKFQVGQTVIFQGQKVKVESYEGGKDRCYKVSMAGAVFTVKESEIS